MTERDDSPLDDATWRALRESDDLVPTSEAEVERAEASLSPALQLPPRLQSYRDPVASRRAAPAPRRSLRYVAAAALGAAAAAAALLWRQQPPPTPVTSAGGELVRPSASAPPPPVALDLRSRCGASCCAGSDCKSAGAGLEVCPSGVRCVGCAADNASGGPYRLRLGTVIPSEAGQKLLPLSAPLELCVLSAGNEPSCVPALNEPSGEAWRRLKVVTPLQDLLTGLTLELRKRGVAAPLATWKHAVSPTPELWCKGLSIQLSDGTDTLGRLSAFIEPTHFVELARAADVPSLLNVARRYEVTGTSPRVFESSQGGQARFALSLGPFDKADAEALRWQALSRGADAQLAQGLDYVGNPHPLK